MRSLCAANDIVCLQEGDGIKEEIHKIAQEHNMDQSPMFEGIVTSYKPAVVTVDGEGGGHSLDPIWLNKNDGDKAKWRRLLCSTFTPTAAESPSQRFVVGNNHTHDGQGIHKAGNNPHNFKPYHLAHCFKALKAAAREKGALPILVAITTSLSLTSILQSRWCQ